MGFVAAQRTYIWKTHKLCATTAACCSWQRSLHSWPFASGPPCRSSASFVSNESIEATAPMRHDGTVLPRYIIRRTCQRPAPAMHGVPPRTLVIQRRAQTRGQTATPFRQAQAPRCTSVHGNKDDDPLSWQAHSTRQRASGSRLRVTKTSPGLKLAWLRMRFHHFNQPARQSATARSTLGQWLKHIDLEVRRQP